MKYFVFFLLLTQFFACTSFNKGPIRASKKFATFGITEPSFDWQQKSFRGADIFLMHTSKNATIFFSSQCERFSDSPLEALRAQLLNGLSDIHFLSEKRETVADREALISELLGKIDGVERFLKIMVIRKNRCVFDGVFSSPPEEKDLANEFDRLAQSFWAEASL